MGNFQNEQAVFDGLEIICEWSEVLHSPVKQQEQESHEEMQASKAAGIAPSARHCVGQDHNFLCETRGGAAAV